MATLYENFQKGTITDNPLSDSALIINSVEFGGLPVVSSPDIMWLVLDPKAVAGEPEIVRVTDHTSAASSVSVVRGAQSTTARAHVAGTEWILALTKQDALDFLSIADGAVTEAKLGAGAVTESKIGAAAVTASRLANSVITAVKIVDLAVTTAKLAAGAVTTAKLADGAVTSAKLANVATETPVMSSGWITSSINPLTFARVGNLVTVFGVVTATTVAAPLTVTSSISAAFQPQNPAIVGCTQDDHGNARQAEVDDGVLLLLFSSSSIASSDSFVFYGSYLV